MKNLFLSLVLVMVSLFANSQVYTLSLKQVYTFEHPDTISLYDAQTANVLEFTALYDVKVTVIYDLTNKTVTMINSDSSVWEGTITEIMPTGNVFDIYVGNTLVILSNDVLTGDYVLIEENKIDGKVKGEMSFGKNQIEVTIEN